MIFSTIDIGTNTVLMLVADFDPVSGEVKTVRDVLRIPRLGKGVDSNRNITPASFEKAVSILKEYKKISDELHSGKIIATATSFIRDSANRKEFIQKIKSETGIEIEVLPGTDEARWTFWGGTYDKYQRTSSEQILAIDIGGGSTEIASCGSIPGKINGNILNDHPIDSVSIDIGSVRIKERYLSSHPAEQSQISSAEDFINKELKSSSVNSFLKSDSSSRVLIGVAGTVTTLGAVKLGLSAYDAGKVDGTTLTSSDLAGMLERMRSMTLEQLYAAGDFMEGRADVIIPGLLILNCFMKSFGFGEITVSSKGLRYGIFLREAYK